MVTINEETVRSVVAQVVAQLKNGSVAPAKRHSTGAAGVHSSVSDAVGAASEAFEKFREVGIAERKIATQCIRDICLAGQVRLGHMEMDETKIGRRDHKVEKLVTAATRTPGVEALRTDCVSGDFGVTLTEYAPFGVIGAITPVTHSLPTLASNAIEMLAGGNTVVFNAHPSGANVAKEGVRLFNEAIREKIGIDNLITIIDPPTIDSANQLFEHRDVKLIVVTGGPAVARAALGSRKRAIVAGPGNPPVVVDQTADLDKAARSIITGAAYDNNLLCIAEKEIFAVESIFEPLLAAMGRYGGYRISTAQLQQLEKIVFAPGEDGKIHLQKEYVGQDASLLASKIGVTVPSGTEVLYAETTEQSPFVDHEQMMPVLPFVRTRNVDTAIYLAKKYEHGYRHTAIIHSNDLRALTRMGKEMDCTVYVKNGPSTAGIGSGGEGLLSFSIATPTGEGVTSPLTFTRLRRCTMVESLRII
ncbi:aldehyde dehydrogenase EutE [bacterium]|nr:aldehyde dehydrogenase EutE [bacterium]